MKIENQQILEYSFPDIIGQKKIKNGLKSALLSQRNILVIGPPGVGKTSLAKNVAKLLSQENFIRVQGSPDLTSEDLIGDIDPIKAMEFGAMSPEAFSPGKLFKAHNGVLFFDELNRCPEKLQNALLQVLEERKATIGSYTVDYDADFIFIATMNPEDTNTEPLSDVLLDRFDVLYMSYPESLEYEMEIVKLSGKDLGVQFPNEIYEKMVLFVRMLRENSNLEKHPSVRATLGLYERAQANAIVENKVKVEFKHVMDAFLSVLSHRIRLKPSLRYVQSTDNFLNHQIEQFMSDNKMEEGGDG